MSESSSAPAGRDVSARFLFEQADIRGETVQLDRAYRDVLSTHQYPPAVSSLLGEFLAGAVLLSTTLKFEGRLVLQARSEAEVPLVMAECSSDLEIRGIVQGAQQATGRYFEELLAGGRLAITIEPLRGRRYQGLVPLESDSLAGCIDSYFRQSEQLPTRLWLATTDNRAAGMLIQQLPPREVTGATEREQQWQHVVSLAATVRPRELLNLPTGQLLHRLFKEHSLRLFRPRPVSFCCSCSKARTLGALATLGAQEVESILQEQGRITMDCEFCNTRYLFTREDLGAILGTEQRPTLH